MFGFGMGRIAPNDRTFAKLERDGKRGRAIKVPAMECVRVPALQVAFLKSLPRAGVVTPGEAVLADEAIQREPGMRVQGLTLPASQFVFELAPHEADIATIRIVQVRMKLRDGIQGAQLLAAAFYAAANKWCLTVPGAFDVLSAFTMDAEHMVEAEPTCGLPSMRHEMRMAAAGLLVIARRHAEMLRAALH